MKNLFYILAAVRAILVFGGMVIFMLFYGISCIFKKHTSNRAFKLRKVYLKYWCIPILNIKVEKHGKPSEIPSLYVSNHRSFADPIVLCRYIDAFVIAKAEVMNYPIINKGAELTGVIWVNRLDQHSRNHTRSKMVETIQGGFNVLVYPEGTVGKLAHTLPFRKGTFIEAGENNTPVVPVAIEFKSEKDLWVLEKFLPQYFYQFSKWKTEVKLSFGEPLNKSDGLQLHHISHDWINLEVKKMQKDWSEVF
ncbi:MAG: lysophospholipid acyltransferase family protein [Saprospiraceae bacterium]|nr:1-acyl-sn-glycerol-3-phosphate acyltransferase [Saprospiraceae bacterium]MBP6446667.1 1-acyl-sn-glycerol-3-phosphate acyltransferase [Saprospiraceae bacterium]